MKWEANAAMVWGLSLLLSLGCHANPEGTINDTKNDTEHLDQFLKKSDALYDSYLDGDQKKARESLEELLNYTKAAKLKPYGHANALYIIYSHLYAFEKRIGNQALAETDFAQVRYWQLQRLKLNGESDSQAEEEVKNYASEQCLTEVDDWDKASHKGMLPKYLGSKPSISPQSQ